MSHPWTTATALLLAALAVFLRVSGLADFCLDGDEIFSVITVRYGWDHFAAEVVKDAIHPPFFYLLLRGWIGAGGEYLGWVRLFPALTSALTVAPLWMLCRELGCGRLASPGALGLFAANPFLIGYAQHLRMYSLLGLLSVVSLWLCVRLLRSSGTPLLWAGWFGVNLALVYTQYYGWVVFAIEVVILFVWKREARRLVLIASAGLVLCFLPWAWLAAGSLANKGGAGENLGWIQRPGWSEFLWFFVDLCGLTRLPNAGATIVFLVMVLLLIVLWQVLRAGRTWDAAGRFAFAACFAFLPPGVAFLVSHLTSHSIWGHRHLIVSAVPFLLLCAMAAERIPGRIPRLAGPVLLAIWMLFGIWQSVRPRPEKVPWDSLALEILEREPASSGAVPLYAAGPHLHFPLWFFLEEWKRQRTGLMAIDPPNAPGLDELARRATLFEVRPAKDFADLAPGHLWVAVSSASWPAGPSAREILDRRGCTAGEESRASDWFQQVTAFPAECR